MATKKIGISRELIIHPGETIADVLEERGMTQAELAAQTGVSRAYVSSVIAGKKDISANFALALEYAFGVPKSFWLNLQANYEAELLELNKMQTITEEERQARRALKDVVRYLRSVNRIPQKESLDESILSMREVLNFRNLDNLKDIVPEGAFRMSGKATVNEHVLGAWIRLCQLTGNSKKITVRFENSRVEKFVSELKKIMISESEKMQEMLVTLMENYGIDFSIVPSFRGAPVQGYISMKTDGTYQMVVSTRGAFADIFWFSLFHELGHLVNGDVGRNFRFLDDGNDAQKEQKADLFARDQLLNPKEYEKFLQEKKYFQIEEIKKFAMEQGVMPYIVIGRLQRENHLDYSCFNNYKIRYQWTDLSFEHLEK